MPCNLAVSITKAAIPNEYLASLLTPEIVALLLRQFLNGFGKKEQPASFRQSDDVEDCFVIRMSADGTVQCRIGGYLGIDLFVDAGMVTVNTTYEEQREQAEQLQQQITTLLSLAADRLFAAQIQQQLGSLISSTQIVAVENDGMPQQATVFTISL